MLRIALPTLLGCSVLVQAALCQPPLPDPLEAGWQGRKVCEVLVEDDKHRILRCVFPSGVGHERHYHAPHTGYVLAGGRMRVVDQQGTREVDVGTGTTWSSEGIGWHEVLNVGEETSRYLIIEIKPTASQDE